MRNARIPLLITAAAVLVVSPAEAYYHYVHYLNGNLSTPVYEKFDLTALANKTVTFLVVDSGPANFGANDDFASILSQVQAAAAAWNSVDSSDLRVAFGGLESAGQTANGPGGDVVFTDLPPGLLGMGGVTASQTPANGPNGPFFPVLRSTIQLTNDTSQAPGPSYLEGFFTTAVHEMGHALGLQHTWTSAAMSQDVIRNTSRARPLDADDRAALSMLYGKANWTSAYGSISGRVTANGQPVALASVVAIPPAGPAVSALTNPDGTYTINGLPPNTYFLYVHPLPPDAILNNGTGLRLPLDQNGQPIPAFGSAFRTVLLPGTNNIQQATNFSIDAGTAITSQNFSVSPQSSVSMYDMITYSYQGSTSLTPAYAIPSSVSGVVTVVAQANPPLVTQIPQSVTILGGFASASQCQSANNITPPCFLPYGSPTALAMYFRSPLAAGVGPRHLIFTLPNGDLYVLPDGVNLVQKSPPVIASVTPNGDGTVTAAGSNLGLDSRVFFDGAPGSLQSPFSGSDAQGSISVTPPPGYSGQKASVIVYNADGQNSTYYQSQSPPVYTYPSNGAAQITVNPTVLPAGVSSLVDITAANMQFTGQVTVGLGTTDVSVNRVWLLTPTHMIANVTVAPNAATGLSEISVLSGFQSASQPGAFQIQPGNSNLPAVALPVANSDSNQTILYPGAAVTITGSRLSTGANSTQVTLNGQSVQVLSPSSNQVSFVIPAGFSTGMAVLVLNNGTASAPPVEIEIDNAPPAIQQITSASSQLLDAAHFASSGDILLATVSNVDPAVTSNTSRVTVTVGGTAMPVLQVAAGSQRGSVVVTFTANQSFGGATVPVVVAVDGVRSSPYAIIVR